MPAADYSFTPGALRPPTTISVRPEGLSVVTGAVSRRVPWAEIRTIQLAFDPTRFDRQRFECRLFPRAGAPIGILSTSYLGPGRFQLQAAEYRQIVEEIHECLRAQGKDVAFAAGTTSLRYGINIAILFTVLGLLVPALVIAGTAFLGPLVILQLIAMAVGLWWAGKWFLANRPSTYDPRAIPEGLLP